MLAETLFFVECHNLLQAAKIRKKHMKTTSKKVIAFSVFALLANSQLTEARSPASDKYDIYYLTIGSGYYQYGGQDMQRPEAVSSAMKMASMLHDMGGKGDAPLVSTEGGPVTYLQMSNAIFKLGNDIARDKPKNPLIVLYYMGHGLGDKDTGQFVALGDYKFNMVKSNDKEDGVYKVVDIAHELNNINPSEKVLNDEQVNFIIKTKEDSVRKLLPRAEKLKEKLKNTKSPEEAAKFMEDFSKESDEIALGSCATFAEDARRECEQNNARFPNVIPKLIALGKRTKGLHGKDVSQMSYEERVTWFDTQVEMMELNGGEANGLRDWYKKTGYKDPKSYTEEENAEYLQISKQYGLSYDKYIEKITGNHFDRKVLMDPTTMAAMTKGIMAGIDGSSMNPLTPQQITEMEQKRREIGRQQMDNITPMVTPTNLHPHTPYLIIMDACSSGLASSTEEMANQTKEQLQSYSKSLKDSISSHPGYAAYADAKVAEYDQSINQSMILQANINIEYTMFALIEAGTFKDQGSLFFAANPGDSSSAFVSQDDRLARNPDKSQTIGRMAKRFQLAVEQVNRSGHATSLGEFVQYFSADHPDGLQENSATLPKPFTWFKLPDKLSNTIFIKAQ